MPSYPTAQRGSVLLVALLLSAAIGISLLSYLQLCKQSLQFSQRSFYANAAMNLAEIGVEEALYCFNQLDNVANAADAWASPWVCGSGTDTTAHRTFSTLPAPAPGASVVVKVYVSNYKPATGASPVIVAQATLTPPTGAAIVKMIEVTLRRRSLFATGLVARTNVNWGGNQKSDIDSWNSDPDNNPATAPVPYAVANRTAMCTVGCPTASGTAVTLSGEIYGFAASGGGAIVGGSVHGLGTTVNDPSRRRTDFAATFPTPAVPSTNNSIVSPFPATLPRAGDTASGSVYYYNVQSALTIPDNTTITASKKVVLVMTNHASVNVIALNGNKSINIGANAELTIYTNGGMQIGGNGFTNNMPSQLIIYGTGTTAQTITFSGNGDFTGIIYAPNATVQMHGGGNNGNVYGSITANTIDMNGHYAFHYDEAVSKINAGNPYGLAKWRELDTLENRAAYADRLNF
ncbi:MAG: hypothetical protein HZA31_10825 [Opitutae bacterium]|nr:hypothetical protein [Opitutae bacterium]